MVVHSHKDSRGALWVACSECTRGGNGDKSCSSGGRHKRWNYLGCFLGVLLDGIEPPEQEATA